MSEPDNTAKPPPQYIFVLIHGSFAPKADWVQNEKSLLRTTLGTAFPNASFDSTFAWRGFLSTRLNNGHGYRVRAGQRLRTHLLELRDANPNAKIFAIAHSHGGNVLLYAAHDEEVAAKLDGIICMATPFLVTQDDDGALLAANSWLTLIKFVFMFGGAFLVPVGILAAITLVYVKVSPLINHYIRIVLNFAVIPSALLIAVAALLFLLVSFPALEDTVEELARGGQRRAERRLQGRLPPSTPVFCLLAEGDEFGRIFRYCERAMDLIHSRWANGVFIIAGVILVVLGNWLAFHALASIRTKAFGDNIVLGALVTVGAALAAFTLSIAVVAPALLTLRTLCHRVATRLRVLIYGWENFPQMLLSNIEAKQVPVGHEDLPEKFDVRHCAKRFTMEGASWLKHCEIYLHKDARDAIGLWLRVKSEHASPACNACQKLEEQSVKPSNVSPDKTVPFLDGIVSGGYGGKYLN
jgi:hypothetical protein